ncbi:MAG: squalene--hopene cyclase [Phycisphaerales bacterium]|nr:squalene--hopene cyclase [Phycisphaerales bacterium]
MTTLAPRPLAVAAPAPPMDALRCSPVSRAAQALLAKQHEDGHFCAELEGDSILNTEYILMKWMLGQEAAPEATPDQSRRFDKMAAYLRMIQREDGTWGQYPGAPADISACVKAYFVLKLMGDDVDAPHMARARHAIRAMGGAEKINTFSMFYLAGLGQVSWDACPSIPPEIALLPRWFPFHMDKVSAWTRTMILPLALCTALRPVRQLRPEQGVDELFLDHTRRTRLNQDWNADNPADIRNVFLAIDRALKLAQKSGLILTRERAIKAAERWILDRMRPEATDGLGAIFPPMVYIQVALKALNYPRSHPVIRNAEHELDRFIIEDHDHVRIQPCFSPVWDSGIALYALTEAGLTEHNDPRVRACCDWLRAREIRMNGDWVRNLRPADRSIQLGVDAAAWAFEYRNDWYPDVDDTAMVAKALRRAGDSTDPHSASSRAVRWILAMQNDDGGWAAFDRTKDRPWMDKVPFADHNAMQDPSCADITGRTIESLVTCGLSPSHPAIRAAVRFLQREQSPDGSWKGRWGVNFIYGTWQAVGGLAHAGESIREPYLQRTLQWLRSIQNDDGGFGETADSYLDDALKGRGPSTASQTAWAAMALMFLVGANDPAVARAVRHLEQTQLDADQPAQSPAPVDRPAPEAWSEPRGPRPLVSHPVPEPAGAWREGWFTGTGFPKVFYLRYHLYRHYFPLMALARYERLTSGATSGRRPGDQGAL